MMECMAYLQPEECYLNLPDDFAVDNFIDDNGIIIPRMRDYYNVGYLLNDKALHQLGNDIEFHQSGGKSKKSKKSNKSRKSRKSRK